MENVNENFNGLPHLTSKTYFITKKFLEEQKVYVWLAKDKKESRIVEANFLFWKKFLNIANLEIKNVNIDSLSFSSNLENLYNSESGIYIIPYDFFKQIPLLINLLINSKIVFKQNKVCTLQSLKKDLDKIGYSFNTDKTDFSYYSKGAFLHIFKQKTHYILELDETRILNITKKTSTDKEKIKKIELLPLDIKTVLNPINTVSVNENKTLNNDFKLVIDNAETILTDDTDIKLFEQYDKIKLFNFNKNSTKLKYKNTLFYKKKYYTFIKDLKTYIHRDFKIFITVNDAQVIENLFNAFKIKENNNIKIIQYPIQRILKGFVDIEKKVVVWTHQDIFGATKQDFSKIKSLIKKTKDAQATFLSNLKIGDYVVHDDHGVGKFLGVQKLKIGDFNKETMVIGYDRAQGGQGKEDKLYVPIETLFKVDKYVGQAKPKLCRLSTVTWKQIKKKVKEDSRILAKELLNLYAQRKMLKIAPWVTSFPELEEMENSFGYQETDDQQKAITDVKHDLKKSSCMDRLVVGDVGFGKTEIALRAAFISFLNRKQTAILCPTTILAEQHYNNFIKRFKNFPVRIGVLNRFTLRLHGKKKVTETIENVTNGTTDILIGTHRLLSKDIKFKNLGLIIIDEEQKFGVKHKEKLKSLKSSAHSLTLTATPIPRTLYFSLAGIRDVSVIQTAPKGRKPIETHIVEYNEPLIKKAILEELKRGGQVYYLYNRVATIDIAVQRLKKIIGKNTARIEIAHGQMDEYELSKIMNAFLRGEIDILVCSSIIENGIDLPNVNTLIVENSTMFGLGQLYQLRGRIGRGLVQAKSYFLYKKGQLKGLSVRRLAALEQAQELGSGFQLAMQDLEIRGIGNILGKEQHGQVMAIGLNLYLKLLTNAILQLENMDIDFDDNEKEDIIVNLPFDYIIPEELIKEERDRILLYRKISQIENIEKLADLRESTLKKFKITNKQYKDNIENLFYMFKLKLICANTDIKSVDYTEITDVYNKTNIVIRLNFNRFVSKIEYEKLLKINNNWKNKGNMVRIKLDNLNKDWKQELEITVLGFKK